MVANRGPATRFDQTRPTKSGVDSRAVPRAGSGSVSDPHHITPVWRTTINARSPSRHRHRRAGLSARGLDSGSVYASGAGVKRDSPHAAAIAACTGDRSRISAAGLVDFGVGGPFRYRGVRPTPSRAHTTRRPRGVAASWRFSSQALDSGTDCHSVLAEMTARGHQLSQVRCRCRAPLFLPPSAASLRAIQSIGRHPPPT